MSISPIVDPETVAGRASSSRSPRTAGRATRAGCGRMLLVLDLASVALAWSIVLALPGRFGGAFAGRPGALLLAEATIVFASIVAIASQRLYLARVSGVRSVEIARLARAAALSAVSAFIVGNLIDAHISGWRASAGGALSFLLLAWFRALYTAWLAWARALGRYCRPVLLIGSNEQAHELYRLIDNHPELGLARRRRRRPGRRRSALVRARALRRHARRQPQRRVGNGRHRVSWSPRAPCPRDELDELTRGLLRAGTPRAPAPVERPRRDLEPPAAARCRSRTSRSSTSSRCSSRTGNCCSSGRSTSRSRRAS